MEGLERSINELNRSFKELSDFVKNMDKSINSVTEELSGLNNSVSNHQDKVDGYSEMTQRNFAEQKDIFANGLNKLASVLNDGFNVLNEHQKISLQLLEAFKRNVNKDIVEFKENNSNLLTNVTTGIALTELLKSAFISDESETAIERSVIENEDRFVKTRKDIEQVKQLYDKYIENMFVSFFKQFKQIANHVLEIQYNIFDKLRLEGYIDKNALTNIKQADDIRTENRQKKFDEISKSLNDECFANFSSIRKKIEEELSARNILHTYSQKGIDNIPILSLPILIIESNEWKNWGKKFIESYGLNDPVSDCYEKIKIKEEFERYRDFVNALPKKDFQKQSSEIINKDDLIKGLEELYKNNYLKDEHYHLVKKHFETYQINVIEKRS